MEQPVRCRCGHAVREHARTCEAPGCGCRRDRFDALESALDLAAEARRNPAPRVPVLS